jgi:DNA-binding protein H-NS
MPKQNLASMSVDALIKMRDDINAVLGRKVDDLKRQLARLGNGVEKVSTGRASMRTRKLAPKYRSKKNPKFVWAGRGAIPRWMREEMKGTKLKKESFKIK